MLKQNREKSRSSFFTEYVPRVLFRKTAFPPFRVEERYSDDVRIELIFPILALFTRKFNMHGGTTPYVLPEDHTKDDRFAWAVKETVSAISNFGKRKIYRQYDEPEKAICGTD